MIKLMIHSDREWDCSIVCNLSNDCCDELNNGAFLFNGRLQFPSSTNGHHLMSLFYWICCCYGCWHGEWFARISVRPCRSDRLLLVWRRIREDCDWEGDIPMNYKLHRSVLFCKSVAFRCWCSFLVLHRCCMLVLVVAYRICSHLDSDSGGVG